MKKRSFFLLFMLALLTTTQAQKVVINGVEGDRLLTWNDFKGEPDKGSPYFANTAWTTLYLDQVKFTDTVALLTSFQFTLMLDPKSTWLKPGKGSDALLKHEQGHFDIGYLFMQEVIKNIKTVSFSRQNFQKELEAFITKIHQKYTDLNKQYDDETAHSANKEAQEKWNNYFDKERKR